MATCRIISWNVRGLNCKIKHALVFNYLKQHKQDIIMLQETHLRGQKVLALKKPWIGLTYHSVYSNYTRGVSILVSKALDFDQSGRYIILQALLRGKEYVFVGVYVPPPFQQVILDEIIGKLSIYPNILFINLGDFNATLSHSLDRLYPRKHITRPYTTGRMRII